MHSTHSFNSIIMFHITQPQPPRTPPSHAWRAEGGGGSGCGRTDYLRHVQKSCPGPGRLVTRLAEPDTQSTRMPASRAAAAEPSRRCAPSSRPARCRAATPAPLRGGGEGGLQCVNVPCRPARRPRAATCGGAGGGAQPAGPANLLARGKGGAGGNRAGGGGGRGREGEGGRERESGVCVGCDVAERQGGASGFGGKGGASGRREQCWRRGLR